jgi:holo-[acyl-carrier protein] synthase
MSKNCITGIGIDIESIQRFREKPFLSHKNFYQKLFTPHEIDYCLQHQDPSPHFAARFCAKESLRKAIPKSIHIDWHDVEIRNDDSGKPLISLRSTSEDMQSYYKSITFHLSLSHDKNRAVAFVIAENA